jgi:hypothetical protein
MHGHGRNRFGGRLAGIFLRVPASRFLLEGEWGRLPRWAEVAWTHPYNGPDTTTSAESDPLVQPVLVPIEESHVPTILATLRHPPPLNLLAVRP